MKVALTGPVQLELIAPYFAKAGYGVAVPGEIPDLTYDVTSHERVLAEEVDGFYDARLEKLAGCPYSLAGIEAIVEEFQWFAATSIPHREPSVPGAYPHREPSVPGAYPHREPSVLARPTPRKVLAVDADNTLWHGILSEDGPDALVPCTEFQQGLRQLADEGVVLVLLSKNDPGSIEALARRDSPFSTLHSSFSATRVNWAPKPGNLIDVCRELKLGLDSVVFVDDNPHERAMMKAHLPEVAVAPWNGWTSPTVSRASDGAVRSPHPPTVSRASSRGLELSRQRQLLRRLREYFFSDTGRTAEDRLRGDSYANLRRAEATLARFASHDDYLKSLGLWVEARPAEARDLDRLAQMAGKTNQFNATTIRRSREEFAGLLGCGPREDARLTMGDARLATGGVFVFRAGDRFGEQGIVGYAIIDGNSRRITDFVMSCRAMGRTLECFAYEWIAKRLGYRPTVDFVPTAKNAPAKEFVEKVNAGLELRTYYGEKG